MSHYRTIFISDLHLGGSCHYEALMKFLHNNDADTWYIVGDFIDFWAVTWSKKWPQEASNVLRTVLGKAKRGAKVYIIPGNHDSQLRAFDSFQFGNIEIHNRMIHTFANGKTALVIHGDLFDSVIGHAVWLARIGSVLYDGLVTLNGATNWIRQRFGMSFWSFSATIKKSVKRAVNYVSDFKKSIMEFAETEGTRDVICGHIHNPEILHIQPTNKRYINCGDWVESLSAVVEYQDGSIELRFYNPLI